MSQYPTHQYRPNKNGKYKAPSTIMPPSKFRVMQAKGMVLLAVGLIILGIIMLVLKINIGWLLIVGACPLFLLSYGLLLQKSGGQEWKYIPLQELRRHNPLYVEEYVAGIFRRLGVEDVEVTQQMGDGGIDVLMEINGARIGVQVKRYAPNHYVQVDEVRAVLGSREQLRLDKVVFVTTSQYTRYVWETIRKENIYLIDGNTLDRLGVAARAKVELYS